MKDRVQRALLLMSLSALTGCASGPFRHKPAPVVPAQQDAPELSQTPLYSPEMSENDPHLPSLPSTTDRPVVPAPTPVAEKPRHTKKTKPPLVAKGTPTPPAKSAGGAADGAPNSSTGTPTSTPTASGESATASGPAEKKLPQQASLNSTPGPSSPIGELTAGSPEDAAQANQHTQDLIKATRDGLDGIKRQLSAEEKKTIAEIGTFLSRAQQALKNGDGDGALGLATKAKLLLDELTQQ